MSDSNNDPSTTRRALIAALIGGTATVGSLSPVSGYLRAFAPLSGTAWETPGGGTTIENPFGEATVRIDDEAVPHVEADDERAASFAVGYVQAAHRLFQIDLQRRVMRGRLSEVVGPATVDSDKFHVQMDFVRAAEASWERIRDTDAGAAVRAFADGVTARIEDGRLPVEFRLLDYEPATWTPVDTMLMEKQIAWALTGSFRSLRRAVLTDRLGASAVEELFPRRYDHDTPILRDADGQVTDDTPRLENSVSFGRVSSGTDGSPTVDPDLVSWLSEFESPPGFGSNSWVVSGAHTASGDPLLANDPHLALQAPPIWYEQHVSTPGATVRGVTFPGVPFVVIGASEDCAWGFTNPGSDQLDCYTYETRGEHTVGTETVPAEYRYGEAWRAFETTAKTISVADGEDRTVPVRTSVHGPVLEREGREVGVAWTGLVGSGVTEAMRDFAYASTVDEIESASRQFDAFSQCLVAADVSGGTLFRVTGRVPIRRTDGEAIRGDRVHDGSAREGEWPRYEPYTPDPDWSGTIPFEEMPARKDPDLLATANQRIIDDEAYPYYFAEGYAEPWRGIRIYDLLDAAVAADDPLTMDDSARVQRDVLDGRAERLVEQVTAAVRSADTPTTSVTDADLREAAATLANWDRRMTRDSRAALLFDYFIAAYRERVFADRFADADLGERYWPADWTLVTLDADAAWFGEESRDVLLRESLADAVARVADGDATVYGDVNTTAAIQHPFGQSFLNYPVYPTDGSPATPFNYRRESAAGSSWRMLWSPAEARAILPGGNAGLPFSNGYANQLERWADGEYKPLRLQAAGDVAFRFTEDPDA